MNVWTPEHIKSGIEAISSIIMTFCGTFVLCTIIKYGFLYAIQDLKLKEGVKKDE